jgi:hypothetical protein
MICQAFSCVPSVAEREDLAKVRAVLEWRMAEAGIAMANRGQDGLKELAANPAIGTLLLELHMAQDLDLAAYVVKAQALGARTHPRQLTEGDDGDGC